MGIFFKSARDRAKNMWGHATITKRNLAAAVDELRHMEHLLEQIAKEIPKGAPGSSLKSMETHMKRTEHSSHSVLLNLRRTREHLKQLEHHLRQRQQ